MATETARHVRTLIFTYAEFRHLTELTKKEADNWVKNGVIRSEMMPNQRRRYRFDSVVEGIIAKQLADFSSRTLLQKMMETMRKFLKSKNIDLMKVEPHPRASNLLITLYTRNSDEIVAGGGVRGVTIFVGEFQPESKAIGKTVFLVVNLNGVVLETLTRILQLRGR
jgi:hypothetical protein